MALTNNHSLVIYLLSLTINYPQQYHATASRMALVHSAVSRVIECFVATRHESSQDTIADRMVLVNSVMSCVIYILSVTNIAVPSHQTMSLSHIFKRIF